MAYDFLHWKLSHALSSLTTGQRIVSKEYQRLHKGEFRFDELPVHLNSYNASRSITVGEDAMRVTSRVKYESKIKRLLGFVLLCND